MNLDKINLDDQLKVELGGRKRPTSRRDARKTLKIRQASSSDQEKLFHHPIAPLLKALDVA